MNIMCHKNISKIKNIQRFLRKKGVNRESRFPAICKFFRQKHSFRDYSVLFSTLIREQPVENARGGTGADPAVATGISAHVEGCQ